MKIGKRFRNIAVIPTVLALTGVSAAIAADKPVDIGKGEYDAACAVCHGFNGKGESPMAGQLTARIPDLTRLAQNNNGVFPFDRVFQVIDGRQEIKAHGTRDMPIWGRAFSHQTSIYFQGNPPHDQESVVRSRVLALTEYVYRLQSK